MLKYTITDEQWVRYLSKYENLIWTIARKISGDEATANLEDNFSDLCAQGLVSIDSYCRKENISVDEALSVKGFDAYTKTVLWNYKAKKGIPLTKKMGLRNKMKSIHAMMEDPDSTFDIEDRTLSVSSTFGVDEMFTDLDANADKILRAILDDPSVLSVDGHLKVASLVSPTGLTLASVNKGVTQIKKILEKNYETRN